ncbi:hypothetical protein J6590_071068, partial [Homalodisca vitripennis]
MSNHPSPRKRKVSNPDSYIRTKNKNARLKGQEYVSPSGKTVASKQPEFDCRCANQCLKKIGEDGCTQIFSKFYNLSSKNEQDLFLQGQVDAIEVQRRRPSTDTPQRAQKTASFKYHVVNGSKRTEVCFKGFLSLYNISEKRVRRIRNLKLVGEVPLDKRG